MYRWRRGSRLVPDAVPGEHPQHRHRCTQNHRNYGAGSLLCSWSGCGLLDLDGRYSGEVGRWKEVSETVSVELRFHGVMDQEGIDRRLKGWRKAIEKSLNWVDV